MKFRTEVAGIGENTWSSNGILYDNKKEAEQWLNDLSIRWAGFDMSRIVPEEQPKMETINLNDSKIFQNFRKK